jgi:hypothetical protein
MICALAEIGAYMINPSAAASFHLKRLSSQGPKKELIVKFMHRIAIRGSAAGLCGTRVKALHAVERIGAGWLMVMDDQGDSVRLSRK